jgi:hypothetical protein
MPHDAPDYFAVAISHIVVISVPMVRATAFAGLDENKLIPRTRHVRHRRLRELPGTQDVERCDCGHKLRTEQVISHDIVKPIDQCDIFGTEGFFQCLNFQVQFLDSFAVFLRRGLFDLLTEFPYIAIGLCFGFVAADVPSVRHPCSPLGFEHVRTSIRRRPVK